MCHHLLSPWFVLKSLSCPSASQTARCRLISLILPHPCLSCYELNTKFGGCPGQAGGVETGLWDGRQAGISVQRPRQVQHGSWLWQGEGPGVLRVSAPSSPPCPRLVCSIERKSRAMPGPICRELWCRQDPFSARKRGAALRCPACCHGGSAASPSGLGWPCFLRLVLPQPFAEPESVAAYPLLLVSLPSTRSRQLLQWAGICTLAPEAAQGGVLPGCLFQPPSAGGPMGICTSMVSGGVCVRGSRP